MQKALARATVSIIYNFNFARSIQLQLCVCMCAWRNEGIFWSVAPTKLDLNIACCSIINHFTQPVFLQMRAAAARAVVIIPVKIINISPGVIATQLQLISWLGGKNNESRFYLMGVMCSEGCYLCCE
jgi:hypothetical protein